MSKIFGKKSKPDDKPLAAPEPSKTIETTSRQSGDWEVLESNEPPVVKEKPPATKEKPKRVQTPDSESTLVATNSEPAPSVKRIPGSVQMPNVNMSELANALGKKKPKVSDKVSVTSLLTLCILLLL